MKKNGEDARNLLLLLDRNSAQRKNDNCQSME
jgi:hypothetical protein